MKEIIAQFAAKVNLVGSSADKKANALTNNVTNILNGIIAALGLVCVVVMLVGGVNYMTSAGDSAKVEKGKKTILYGLIGLIICVLSFAIVNFVIKNIIENNSNANNSNTNNSAYIYTSPENELAFSNK